MNDLPLNNMVKMPWMTPDRIEKAQNDLNYLESIRNTPNAVKDFMIRLWKEPL